MRKTIETGGKIVAAALAASIGLGACGSSSAARPSSEVRIQSQIDGLDPFTTMLVGSTAVNNDGIVNTYLSVLPDRTRVDFQVTYPSHVDANNDPTGVYTNSAVEGIDVTVYQSTGKLSDLKPEIGLDLGKEVDGKWDATFYQYLAPHKLFRLGEQGQSYVEKQVFPGVYEPTQDFAPNEAHHIYNEVVSEMEGIIGAIRHDRTISISPDEIRS